jgi:hypothetical protein
MKILDFFLYLWVIFALLDPDLATKINADPDPQTLPELFRFGILICVGLAKDEMSLRKLGVVKGAKVMVVGSTLSDVLEVAKKPTPQQLKEVEEKEIKRESWSQQKQHKKVQRNDASHN